MIRSYIAFLESVIVFLLCSQALAWLLVVQMWKGKK